LAIPEPGVVTRWSSFDLLLLPRIAEYINKISLSNYGGSALVEINLLGGGTRATDAFGFEKS